MPDPIDAVDVTDEVVRKPPPVRRDCYVALGFDNDANPCIGLEPDSVPASTARGAYLGLIYDDSVLLDTIRIYKLGGSRAVPEIDREAVNAFVAKWAAEEDVNPAMSPRLFETIIVACERQLRGGE